MAFKNSLKKFLKNYIRNKSFRGRRGAPTTLLVAMIAFAVVIFYLSTGQGSIKQWLDEALHRDSPAALRNFSLNPGADFRPLMPLQNQSKDPAIFMADLTARIKYVAAKPSRLFQQATNFMLYNGQSPGPLIDVVAGTHVKINFTNKLSSETTVHFHGLPIPPSQDGNPMDVVKSNTSRIYEFDLPEGMEGNYWYHPHPHLRSAEQAASGLAGPMLVRSKNDPLKKLGIAEENIFITGIRLDNGKISVDNKMDWQHGRMGETLLVNGVVQPVLKVAPGSTMRFRLWNATNARFINISFKKGVDATTPDLNTYLVGTDGGLIAHPYVLKNGALLSAAERREVVVRFDGKAGDIFTVFEENPKLIENTQTAGAMGGMNMNGHDMAGMDMNGHDMASMETKSGEAGGMPGMEVGVKNPLLTIKLTDVVPLPPVTLPTKLRTIAPLPATNIKKKLELTGVLEDVSINGKKFDPKRFDYVSKKGTVEEWTIINRSDMTHPLHIHGGQFQVISHELNGKVSKPPYISWQDTVLVQPGEKVVLRMKQDHVGPRMIHCHILEHEDKGMMAIINVVE